MTDEAKTYVVDTDSYFDLMWTFTEHNIREHRFHAGAMRTVCTCSDCDLLRRMVLDDRYTWHLLIPVLAAKANGNTREEWVKEIQNAMQDLGLG